MLGVILGSAKVELESCVSDPRLPELPRWKGIGRLCLLGFRPWTHRAGLGCCS